MSGLFHGRQATAISRPVRMLPTPYDARLIEARRLAVLGGLAGHAAHELNNLQLVVQGNLELTAETLPADSRARGWVQNAQAASARAAALTNHVLLTAASGMTAVEAAPIDTLVRNAAPLLGLLLGRRATLSIDPDGALLPVRCKPAALHHVLMELVENAGEAAGAGQGRVRLSTTTTPLDARALVRAGAPANVLSGIYVEIDVQDDGEGMDATTLQRAFEPWFSTRGAGRGIGLAIVRRIVEGLGGTVTADSQPGEGSRVRVFLPPVPHVPDVPASPPVQRRRPRRAGRASTVIVVDADPAVRELAHLILRHAGYRVLLASDAATARDQVDALGSLVALVCTSHALPDVDGLTLARQLRTRLPDLPLLFTTGAGDQDLLGQLEAFPDTALLRKPYTSGQLSEAVAELLPAPAPPGQAG